MVKKEIIIGVTGSIAAYKACDIIGRLRSIGHNTTVVMTKEAVKFVTPFLLGHISANRVYADIFESPRRWDPLHISLAEKADLILIAPATANIIAKLAGGLCDEILSCLVVSAKAPVLLAPAMNAGMYLHKITQQNIAKLKKIGYRFVGPVKGRLSCGSFGIGHIADTDEIVKEAGKLLR